MTHFEYMQQQGQLTIDDILSTSFDIPIAKHAIGDNVIINIDNQSDDADFFLYYYPHLINKSGYLVDSKQLNSRRKLYLVEVLGERHWFYESELV